MGLSKDQDIKKPRVALHTLGCRLNFSETGSIAEGFEKRGYEIVPFGDSADVVFINTCTVTDNADSTCRHLVRKSHRRSPEAKIVVAGCYAQMDADRISQIQGVDLVLGTTEKYKVFDYLEEDQSNKIYIDKTADFYGASTSKAEGHTRAFLKIQDGCNYVCSFCIIPQARGRSRAISVSQAVEQAEKLVEEGFQEIVLTGVNIGEYEHSSGERLTQLVARILEVKGLKRLRLSSVEPNTITDELLDVFASSEKFMDHFHIPLQSGDDQILSEMRRKYDRKFYENLLLKIIDRFPSAGIGADLIAGFPGESDEQFRNTLSFVKDLPLTHFHVFPYSKRKNTLASKMENQIQHHLKKQRVKELIDLGTQKLQRFSKDQIGSIYPVLFERKDRDGFYEGYTPNYVRVKLKSERDLRNQIVTIEVSDYIDGSVYAERV